MFDKCYISAEASTEINKNDSLVNGFLAVRNMADTYSGFLKDSRLHF